MKRGVLHAVSLILLVVFMGGVLADSADAVNSVASGKPVVKGVVAVGESLFADVSGVRDLDGVSSSFVYQWVRVDGGVEEDISGATLAIYNVVSADEGKLLKVKVSFIDGVGYSEGPLVSDSTGAVLDAAPIVPHGTKLSGSISLSGFNSNSIWSDGVTLYVLNSDRADTRIYAYRMSDKSHDSGKDFNTLVAAGNDRPRGIWSDGVTMWVSDSVDDQIYAYRMSDKSHDSGKDFNTLDSAGNTDPAGMWSDGVTMWVADFTDGKLYAYRMSDKSRDSGKDFDTLVAAGNGVPIGMWSDGVTMWVGDYGDAYVYAYRRSDKSRDSGKDLDVASDLGGFSLTGLGFDGQAMLVGSWNEVRFYAVDSVYKLPRWSEDSGKDCGDGVSTGCSVDVNGYGVGVVDPAADFDWWSLELEGGKTYAIDVKGAGDQSGNDNAGTLPDPFVILYRHTVQNPIFEDFSDNVSEQNGNSRVVYSVGLDAGGTYYVSVAKELSTSEGGTYTVLLKDLNSVPVFSSSSIFSVDENVRSVGTVVASDEDSQDSVTGYVVSGGVDGALFSITSGGVLSFKSAPNYENPSDSDGDNVYVGVVTVTSGTGSRVQTATQTIRVGVIDVNEPNSPATGKPVISGVVAVGESLFADAYVSDVRDLNGLPDSFVYQWVRVDGGSEEDISGATRAIYNVVLADAGKKLKVKVSFIDVNGYSEGPLVSDFTGAVLDAAPSVSHGTKLSGGLSMRSPIRGGGFGLKNVWSDGITLYGLSFYSNDARIYAYRMSDGSRDRSKEFSNVGRLSRRAIWSDGVTMWLADAGGFGTTKIFAYRMSDKSRDSGKDFNTLGPARNNDPEGIWSDGVTMWVVDATDYKIYAYRMSDKSRDSGKDFNTLNATGNDRPRGIWSDGRTMWVGDDSDDYVYAYRMSDKSRDSGKDLDVDSDLAVFGLTGLGSDGRTMLISSFSKIHFYAIDSPVYKLPRWSEDLGKDCGGDVSTGCIVDVNGYAVGAIDPAADFDWWSLELEGGKTYTIDVKGAGDQSGNDNAGTLPNPFVILYKHTVQNPIFEDSSDNVSEQNGNSRVVYSVGLDAGGTYYVSVAKELSTSEGGTYTVLVKNSNNVPVFSSSSIFSVDENVRSVGTVVASDSDGEDSVTGYSVSGGVDSDLFSITDAGVLSFVSDPDFERPADDGGNNVYNVVVTATSGSGARVRTATQTITITVTDVDEVPLTPSAPSLSSPSSTSLLVGWSAPSNTGPAITDYNVRYRQGTTGPFSSWSHTGNSTNTTITGLNVSTLYEVQVLARTAEGDSGWSEPASFTTGGTVTNSNPIFSSGSSFSVNENVRNVGTVVASDSDGQDGVSGYSVSGGVDSARFSITNGGVLTFRSAPDYESPADSGGNNVYDLVVTVTSGTGSRVRTATQSITVTVDDVGEGGSNSPPVFSSSSSFSVNENSLSVGVVVASDPDNQDGVSGYSVSGGVDRSLFSVTNGGVLTFVSAPDYEVPVDVGGNNVYNLVVTVTSGTGSRVRTATQTITITVTDVDEVPSTPSVSVLSSPSSTSLSVGWSAPSNTGPSIIDYDVGYGLNSNGPFTDWPHSDASRSATITGLNASTLYYVRVLARNAEGDSSWSETASFTTGSAVTNSDPVFTSSSSFSVNENVRNVGTVVASDSDSGDSVTGYSISGGLDSARFSITNEGVLTFRSAPDYESPADSGGNNVYDLVVTVTSGTGSRVRTATQSVTVTVTDVDEAPSNVTSMVALSQDFGNLFSAGNTAPRGIWSSGGVMYVVDSDDYRVYAYNVSTKDFILNQSFDLSSVDSPWGIWSDGVTIWVALEFSSNNDFVDAYNLSDRIRDSLNRDPQKDFSMSNADFSPRGIWSDGVTMWIVQEKGNLSYVDVYKMSDTSSDSGKNFNLTVGHDSPGGVWSDGVTMWIVDLDADVVRAYNLSSGSYDSSKDFSLTSENSDPTGIWSDNETVWVADSVDDKIYSYANLVNPVVNSPATGRPTILGTVQVGRVLTVDVSGIADSDGVPSLFSYQWVRVDGSDEDDISGATGSTYQLVSADVGKKLKVEVSFVDDGGFSEGPLTSDATTLVPAPVNNPPVFSGSATFSVSENGVGVGTVVASDSDQQDDVTGYSVSGGVDSALFAITNGGVLTFKSVPDFERPSDTGANNGYVVVVEATSGTGGRVNTATQTITITVTDVDEVPSTPSVPVLSSPSSTSLLVGWSAPSNTGPAIIDYDVGYGRNLNGPFADWPHSGASRSAVITGLSAGAVYYVRVLARNAEGNSSWSETASFTTVSVVVNSDPVFTSSSSFFVNENLLSVGIVVASDSDGGDSVTDYSVSGGVDRSLFSVTNAGVLTFVSAPDFESPVDVGGNNVYDLVVTVTSGVGGRVRTATQTITIAVTDVDEVPSTPSVPVLSSPSSTSLSVSWSAPSNTGLAIIDYDVQYRQGTSGSFSNWAHAGNSTSTTITSLSANTLYDVQVLARNAEGDSNWSLSGSGRTQSTVTPPTNTDPVFTTSSSFFVNENLLSVGVVVASDSDGQDGVSGYSVSGGLDSARFSITDEGVLTFVSAPDFERPSDSWWE